MGYVERARQKLDELRKRDDFLILAFESSCDETAVAVIRGREILANEIDSQIEIHKRFGGVVPEIASRNHVLAIDPLLDIALEKAGCTLEDIDVIAVTYGAGLLGALLVGVSYAKALAFALDKPLIAIDHIKGHVCASFLAHPQLNFPFLCLLASGGHTEVLDVRSYSDMRILGQTADDAAGEAFDKVARVLGLPYPGGPEIECAAAEGKDCVPLPRPFKGEKTYNFSYSGIKTAVINYAHTCAQRGEEINKADVAASFQARAVGMLIENAVRAAQEFHEKTIVIAGGVAANTALREGVVAAAAKRGITALLPPKKLCTDNAAMIGEAAYFAIKEGIPAAELLLDADPNL